MNSKFIIMLFAYGNFCHALCISLQAPFFPREAELKGATPIQYGFVFAIYELTIVIMSPIIGRFLSPRASNRSMIGIGLLTIGLAVVSFGFLDLVPAGTPFISMAYIIRCIEGLGAVCFVVASHTAVTELFPNNVATAFSIMESSLGLGLIVGPTLGSVLYTFGGYELPFVVLGSMMLIGNVAIFVAQDKPKVACDSKEKSQLGFGKLLNDFGCLLDALSMISAFTLIGFNAAFLEPHLRQFDISVLSVGFIFIIEGGIFGLTTPIVGKICDKGYDARLLIIYGHVLIALGITLIGPIPLVPIDSSIWLVCVSLVMIGVGVGLITVPAFFDCMSGSIYRRGYPDSTTTYALISSLMFSCSSTGAFVGPFIGSYLFDWYGYRWALFLFVAIEIILGILCTCYTLMTESVAQIKASKALKSNDNNPPTSRIETIA